MTMDNFFSVEDWKGNIQQPWWKKQLVIVLILFIARTSTACLSPNCVSVSKEVLEYINTSIDPCNDFYQFSCGNFLNNTRLQDSATKDVNMLMSDNVNNRVREIVEESQNEDDSRAMTLAKKFYKTCINQQGTEQRKSLTLIKDSLKQIGGWPLLEGNNWKEKDFEWKSATYKLRELGYGFEFFIRLQIMPDETNLLKPLITLDVPSGLLYRPINELSKTWIVDMAVAFGAEKAKAKDELNKVLDFQKALFTNSNKRETDSQNTYTMSKLQYQFHDIPLQDYISKLFFPIRKIADDQLFSVAKTAYFSRLQDLLKTTPKRVIANYIAWSTILHQSYFLTTETWMWNLMTKRYLSGNNDADAIPRRRGICTQLVDYLFPWPVKAAYVRKYFSEDAKALVTELLENIKDEFKQVITDLKWLDQEARNEALKNLTSIKNYVGFPSYLKNVNEMEERYEGVNMENAPL